MDTQSGRRPRGSAAAAPDAVQMILVFQASMTHEVTETSTQMSEEVLESRQCTGRTDSCRQVQRGQPRRFESDVEEMIETPGWWSCQTHGLLQADVKAATVEGSSVCPTGQHPKDALVIPWIPDPGHGVTRFNVCPDGPQSCFGSIFSFSTPPWNEN